MKIILVFQKWRYRLPDWRYSGTRLSSNLVSSPICTTGTVFSWEPGLWTLLSQDWLLPLSKIKHKWNDGVKNVWRSDKSWEPGIQKFECYWKLWKTYQPKHFQINSQTRRVHLQRYCWTLWNNKSFHIVQNNAPLINEKTSSGPRICGTTKNVCITTFNWNKRHAKLCY